MKKGKLRQIQSGIVLHVHSSSLLGIIDISQNKLMLCRKINDGNADLILIQNRRDNSYPKSTKIVRQTSFCFI